MLFAILQIRIETLLLCGTVAGIMTAVLLCNAIKKEIKDIKK